MGMPSPYCEEDPPPIGMNYAVWMLAYGAVSSHYRLDTKIFHIWGRVRNFTLQTATKSWLEICLPHHWNLAQVQKTIAASAPLWIISLDLSKAFDKVDWNALWSALRQHGIPEHLIWILQCVYYGQTGVVKERDVDSCGFDIRGAVRQGCVFSPRLFMEAEGLSVEDGLKPLLDL